MFRLIMPSAHGLRLFIPNKVLFCSVLIIHVMTPVSIRPEGSINTFDIIDLSLVSAINDHQLKQILSTKCILMIKRVPD